MKKKDANSEPTFYVLNSSLNLVTVIYTNCMHICRNDSDNVIATYYFSSNQICTTPLRYLTVTDMKYFLMMIERYHNGDFTNADQEQFNK